MKAYIDKHIAESITRRSFAQEFSNIVKGCCQNEGVSLSLTLPWPSFLQIIDCNHYIEQLPLFNDEDKRFSAFINALSQNTESIDSKKYVHTLCESLFDSMLLDIKKIPEFSVVSLLEKLSIIDSLPEIEKNLLSASKQYYEDILTHHPDETLNDMTHYLAWDRFCTNLSAVFDSTLIDPIFQKHLDILQAYLIQKFLKLMQSKVTQPSLTKLIEPLFFFEMRQNKLQGHTEREWQILCQGFKAIRPSDTVCDVYYIDHALHPADKKPSHALFFTSDTRERTNATIALSQCILEKIKDSFPVWNYQLYIDKIVYVTLST